MNECFNIHKLHSMLLKITALTNIIPNQKQFKTYHRDISDARSTKYFTKAIIRNLISQQYTENGRQTL